MRRFTWPSLFTRRRKWPEAPIISQYMQYLSQGKVILREENWLSAKTSIILSCGCILWYNQIGDSSCAQSFSSKTNSSSGSLTIVFGLEITVGFLPDISKTNIRKISWGWWDEWEDTVLQTQDLKFKPWRFWGRARYISVLKAPHNTEFTSGWGRNIFVSFKSPRPGNEPRTLAWKAEVLTTTIGPPPSSLDR